MCRRNLIDRYGTVCKVTALIMLLSARAWARHVAPAHTPEGACIPHAAESRWAGHLIAHGSRAVPLLGTVPTRTDSYVLATMRVDQQGQVHVTQTTCAVRMTRVLGVQTQLSDATAERLPRASFVLQPVRRLPHTRVTAADPSAAMWQGTWEHAFGTAGVDDDDDGKPGVSIEVDVPLCGGTVYVGAASFTDAHARCDGPQLHGRMAMQLSQTAHGASNACLRLGHTDMTSGLEGTFRYTRLPQPKTCADLQVERWPVRADAPRALAAPPVTP